MDQINFIFMFASPLIYPLRFWLLFECIDFILATHEIIFIFRCCDYGINRTPFSLRCSSKVSLRFSVWGVATPLVIEWILICQLGFKGFCERRNHCLHWWKVMGRVLQVTFCMNNEWLVTKLTWVLWGLSTILRIAEDFLRRIIWYHFSRGYKESSLGFSLTRG